MKDFCSKEESVIVTEYHRLFVLFDHTKRESFFFSKLDANFSTRVEIFLEILNLIFNASMKFKKLRHDRNFIQIQ